MYANLSLSIICNHEDNSLYINGIFEDITHIKEVQREKESLEMVIRNQQKLESIGTLASGVAHEINNPIMVY